MIRRLFIALSVLSMLLCIGIVVLWVRSYGTRDAAERDVAQEYVEADWGIGDIIYSVHGQLLWVHSRHPDQYGPVQSEKVRWRWFHPLLPQDDPEPGQNDLYIIPENSRRSRFGWATDLVFDSSTLRDQWNTEGFYLAVPHKTIVLLFGLPVGALTIIGAVKRRRSRRRSSQQRCITCGYDLRASKERCPECGTSIGPTIPN